MFAFLAKVPWQWLGWGVTGFLLFFFSIFVTLQNSKIEKLEAKIETYRGAVDSGIKTINALTADKEAVEQVLFDREKSLERLAQAHDEAVQMLNGVLNNEPESIEWGSVAVPDAVINELRKD